MVLILIVMICIWNVFNHFIENKVKIVDREHEKGTHNSVRQSCFVNAGQV